MNIYKLIKRFFDFAFALVCLILYSPIFLIFAIIIKVESPGPVFFKLTRVGQNMRMFKAYKFRTMYLEADKILHQAYITKLITGELGPEKGEAYQKLKNDPRITRVGLFLRRYSLDELPQVFNILLGDMSFIGPRAAFPYELAHYEEWQKERFKIKPGLTGLWQVYGREAGKNFDEMVKMDNDYITRQSFLLDTKILLKTVFVAMSGTRV